jgi:hypothetical protein
MRFAYRWTGCVEPCWVRCVGPAAPAMVQSDTPETERMSAAFGEPTDVGVRDFV